VGEFIFAYLPHGLAYVREKLYFCAQIVHCMIKEYQVRVLPYQAASEQSIIAYLAAENGFDARTVTRARVLKRSIDARQRTIYVNLKVRLYVNEMPQDDAYVHTHYPYVGDRPQVVVVGAGPGGLFAALKLIELGFRPIVVERGKHVHERKKDMALIAKTHRVDPESNYCFGEGGAGAYSDGKLYTRSKKRGSVDKILNVFCQHGASASILADAHPHIGTDKLPRVIENMRNTIRQSGGEVHFRTRMTALLTEETASGLTRVVGITAIQTVSDGPDGANGEPAPTHQEEKVFRGPVVLATGHSARDVYRYLVKSKVEVEAKGIAVGVRLEHPQSLIDQIQYHSREGRGQYLPAAEYSFVAQSAGRGVYSFCMCPGGYVIPAATGPEQLVVNGMSPSNRGTKWSNSGMVVEIRPEDIDEASKGLVGDVAAQNAVDNLPELAVMRFQERLERVCWQQGNKMQTAPAQRMADFVNSRLSYDLPKSSYAPGLISSPLHFWMPPFVTKRLQEGFLTFGRNAHGFLTNEAVMIGMETRTSSPVRIVRNHDTLQHVRLEGLFPCGEGAGYAGGIVSAGIDGERCAEMAAEYLKS